MRLFQTTVILFICAVLVLLPDPQIEDTCGIFSGLGILRRKIPAPLKNRHRTHRTLDPRPPQPKTRSWTESALLTLPNPVIACRREI